MGTQVDDILKDLVARHFDLPRQEIDLDMPIEQVPDSLAFSVLVADLEQRFDIALDDGAIAKARVLRDLVTMVENRLAAARRPS